MARRRKTWRLLSCAAAAGCAALAVSEAKAATINIQFESASDLNQFVVNHDGTAVPTSGANSNFQFATGVGVGGSNGLTTTNVDAGATYVGSGSPASNVGFDLTQATSVSQFFKGASLGTDRVFQVGFINEANNSFNNDGQAGNTTAFISVRPYGTGQLEFQTKSNGAGTANTTVRAGGTNLTNNNWYKLTLNVQETGAGTNLFNYTVALDDFGASGTLLVGNVFTSASAQTTVTGFNTTATAGQSAALPITVNDSGFGAFRQVTDAPSLDNLTLTGTTVNETPEPAGLGLFALGGLGVLRRKRHNRGT